MKQTKISNLRLFAFFKRTIGGLLLWLFQVKIEGAELMPKDGGVILCSNHLSMIDVIVLGAGFNRPLHYLAKVELFKIPLFGSLIRALGAISVNRGRGDTGAIRSAKEVLEAGRAFCIFPEGSRSKDLKLGKGKAGVGLILRQTGAPVLPAAIICKTRPGLFKKTILRFGHLMPPSEFGEGTNDKKDYQACADLVMQRISELMIQKPQ